MAYSNLIPCGWFIDRTPDYDILNITNNYRNRYRNYSLNNMDTEDYDHNVWLPDTTNQDVISNNANREILHNHSTHVNTSSYENFNVLSRFRNYNSNERYFNSNAIDSFNFNNVRQTNDDILTLNEHTSINSNENFIEMHVSSSLNERIKINIINFVVTEEDKLCCICMEDRHSEEFCKLNCLHIFCIECINHHLQNKQSCPICRSNITAITAQTLYASNKIQL